MVAVATCEFWAGGIDGEDHEEREEGGDSFNCSENMDRDNSADRHSEL